MSFNHAGFARYQQLIRIAVFYQYALYLAAFHEQFSQDKSISEKDNFVSNNEISFEGNCKAEGVSRYQKTARKSETSLRAKNSDSEIELRKKSVKPESSLGFAGSESTTSRDGAHSLQNDPLGYVDSMNLYQGMNMNPHNFVDPMGEELYLKSVQYGPEHWEWLQDLTDDTIFAANDKGMIGYKKGPIKNKYFGTMLVRMLIDSSHKVRVYNYKERPREKFGSYTYKEEGQLHKNVCYSKVRTNAKNGKGCEAMVTVNHEGRVPLKWSLNPETGRLYADKVGSVKSTFIHELIHALHVIRGAIISDKYRSTVDAIKGGEETNLEEHATVGLYSSISTIRYKGKPQKFSDAKSYVQEMFKHLPPGFFDINQNNILKEQNMPIPIEY